MTDERLTSPLRKRAAAQPRAPAVEFEGRTWSYGVLLDAIEEAKRALGELGVRAGDRVLIVNENAPEVLAFLFAAGELDAWPVPVNARLTGIEIDRIAGHCQPRRIIYASGSSRAAAEHAAAAAATGLHRPLLGTFSVSPEDPLAEPEPVPPATADRIAVMFYTSGTTGIPKGVMVSHRNIRAQGDAMVSLRGFVPGDRAYCMLPLSYIGGFAILLVPALFAGACVVLEQRFTPQRIARQLAEGRVSAILGAPAFYEKLYAWVSNGGRLRAPRLRLALCGTSPLNRARKRAIEGMLGVPLHNSYGLTETTCGVCQTLLGLPREDDSVGQPVQGIELRIVDPEGRNVDEGVVGEIIVRGAKVFPGYYRDPEETWKVLSSDGWFATGDLGYRAPSDAAYPGDIYLSGRKKEVIKRLGYLVHPVEVEMVLREHTGVVQCAVVGRSAGPDEDIVAFVQPVPDAKLSTSDLARFLAERLTPYKRPRRIVLVDLLPLLNSGKVDKAALKDMAAKDGSAATWAFEASGEATRVAIARRRG